jgi:hypothetical protein
MGGGRGVGHEERRQAGKRPRSENAQASHCGIAPNRITGLKVGDQRVDQLASSSVLLFLPKSQARMMLMQ